MIAHEPSAQLRSLNQLRVGERAIILSINGDEHFVRRILEMGLTPGEEVYVERIAPLGDPIVVRVRGYSLGLRKVQASAIHMETQSGAAVSQPTMNPLVQRDAVAELHRVALLGNPNCGKTTLFNALTGMRQRVGNYPGVTVERRSGQFIGADGSVCTVIDLPGTYSLTPTSPDEKVAVGMLRGKVSGEAALDGVVVVVDANNLARNLLLFTQATELGLPLVVVLTMMDTAERKGRKVDAHQLEKWLGVPVIAVHARKKIGIPELKIGLAKARVGSTGDWQNSVDSLGQKNEDIGARYRWIDAVVKDVVGSTEALVTFSDRLDRILVHRVFGLGIFALIMYTIFFLIYTVADPFMGMAEDGVAALGELVFGSLPAGPLQSMLMDGVIGGVGGVLVFVPQIAMLFLCIAILEESGYLARAAFLLDRILAAVGLHGKSFIPMLSSHACAIPGIMAARGIESQRDRLATMFVAPFMSCGARLPVYTLLIGVFLAPYGPVAQGLTLLGCYTLGILAAISTALLLRKTALREPSSTFLLELPTYQIPYPTQVLRVVLKHSLLFVKKASTVILGFSILLWASLYYPRMNEDSFRKSLGQQGLDEQDIENQVAGRQVEQSFAGRFGKIIEPVITPLGYDWKIGVGLIGAFAAREVFVGTMGVVYSVGEEADEESSSLHDAMRRDTRDDGSPLWSLATVFSVLVFFVIAMQCISTVAVMRQETGGWKWPLLQLVTMNAMAYIAAMLVYQVCSRLMI